MATVFLLTITRESGFFFLTFQKEAKASLRGTSWRLSSTDLFFLGYSNFDTELGVVCLSKTTRGE